MAIDIAMQPGNECIDGAAIRVKLKFDLQQKHTLFKIQNIPLLRDAGNTTSALLESQRGFPITHILLPHC